MSQWAISCQLGRFLIFSSITIQIEPVTKVRKSIVAAIIQYLIFFCLYSFFTIVSLNKYIIKNNVSIKTNIENIVVTAVEIKLLISFKFIQSEAKNLTSSIVLAFITIKPINAHHTISAIKEIIDK